VTRAGASQVGAGPADEVHVERGGRRWWRWWAVAGTIFIAAYVVVPTGERTASILYATFGAVCVAVLIAGVRRNRPEKPALWYLLAGGQLFWTVGDALFSYYEAIEVDPFPSPADGLYLLGYPLLAAGLLLLVRNRARDTDRAGLIDASIVATGVALLAWVYVIAPLTRENDLSTVAQAVSVAYPAGDLLLLVIVIRLFTTQGARTLSYWLIAASLACVLFADSIFTGLVNMGSSLLNDAADILWLGSYLCFSLAALHPSMRHLSDHRTAGAVRLTRARLIVLAAASLLAPVVLIQQGLFSPHSIDWAPVGLGAVVLFVLVLLRMNDLMARVQEQAAQLSAMAHLDGLTGIGNRRAWDAGIEDAMRTCARTGAPLAVALLDLDHFKLFNDAYGHLTGDRLLRDAAAAWQRHLRVGDLLARYGGEEFAVVLPGATLAEAAAVVDRMRAATPDGQSFSAGVVHWDGSESAEALTARADASLYAAKRAGRDRVVVGAGTG
jgi:diguanylate cyclase (GGDEF)-like protein